jgi:hypothetical protein
MFISTPNAARKLYILNKTIVQPQIALSRSERAKCTKKSLTSLWFLTNTRLEKKYNAKIGENDAVG